jgi:glycosyltransferase involved in cell wall biosynthesis
LAVVPVPCDPGKYAQRYEPISIPQLHDRFVFYTIGEVTRRKNLADLLKAYYLEFHKSEPVALVIKANMGGMPSGEVDKHVQAICSEVRKQLKLYPEDQYPGEIIIAQPFSELEMMRLHATCDCFVMPSYGEAWCIPAFDAMGMGKTPICSDIGGMRDFIVVPNGHEDGFEVEYKKAGWLVPVRQEPCFGMNTDGVLDDLYMGNEAWWHVDVDALRRRMRVAYEDKEKKRERADIGIDRAYDFSYLEVGKKMRGLLDGKEQAVLYDRATPVRKKHALC